MEQSKSNQNKLLDYKKLVGNQVEATLNSLSKAKQDQSDALNEVFSSLKKVVLRQVDRNYKKFLSVIEERISILQTSLIEANQEIMSDTTDVFTLQNMFRFTKRIASEADKTLINEFRVIIDELEKSILQQLKDIDMAATPKISFNDTILIDKWKDLEFNTKPLGLDLVNDKLVVWGSDFYSYNDRDKQIKASEIKNLKVIKLYNKDFILIVHPYYIDIQHPKTGVLIQRTNGDFYHVISVVYENDLVFFVKSNSIAKLDLNTGVLTHKSTGRRVISTTSNTLYLQSLPVCFQLGQVGLYNTRLQLIWVSTYQLEISKILSVNEYLILYSKDHLYINILQDTIFLKKGMNIEQVCLLNPNSLLILGSNALILSLITLELKQLKFKPNKKATGGMICDGTTLSMIMPGNKVAQYKIQ